MFDYVIENFLLNIFFIMFPLIFYQFVWDEKSRNLVKLIAIYFMFTIPAILCMIFPVIKVEGLLFDLRLIPVILAFLYGNAVVSLLVGFTLIGTRFVIGGDGFVLSMISTGISYLFFLFFHNRFHALRLVHKLTIVFVVSFLAKISGKVIFFAINSEDSLLGYAAMFYFIQGVFMALTVYLIEAVRKTMRLRAEILESERQRVASVISASIAHEIRNPLTTIRGFIQLLSAPTELSDDKKRQYGQISLEELDRAQQIISDYLTLAKPHPEHVEILEITEEIKYVGSVLTSYATLQGVQLSIEAEQAANIAGDRQKLRQAIVNIVKNGIESMERGGALELKTQIRSDKAIVIVADSGSGMTQEEIQRLGTPYFSSKEKGTGLGTMVSFSIIKNMAGTITVNSEKGKGTVFEIAFPIVG